MGSFFCRTVMSPIIFKALENKQLHHGLVIAEFPDRRFYDPAFHGAVVDALNIIQCHDPRRFARLCRNLRGICNGPLTSRALYQFSTKICWIDFSRYDAWREEAGLTILLAATVVHEATHGELRRRTRSRRRRREEMICHREEWRCFERLATATGLELSREWLEDVEQFDYRWHEQYYAKSRLTHFLEQSQRIYGAEGFWHSIRREFADA